MNATEEAPAHFAMQYENGTPCDLTSVPRTTTLRFVCQQDVPTHLANVAEGMPLVFSEPQGSCMLLLAFFLSMAVLTERV